MSESSPMWKDPILTDDLHGVVEKLLSLGNPYVGLHRLTQDMKKELDAQMDAWGTLQSPSLD